METGITKNAIITALTKSPHGKLVEYLPVGIEAAKTQAEFLGHMLTWNQLNGQIRDSKVALPVIYLAHGTIRDEFVSNALANIAVLSPREILKALQFSRDISSLSTQPVRMHLKRLVKRYLRNLESVPPKWTRVAVQHRSTLKALYASVHVKPAEYADDILFKGVRTPGSVFEAIANLKNMTPVEAAGTIMERRIPFLIAMGALGAKAKEPDLVLALINRMTPTELVTNTKMLQGLGVKTVPALRAAFEAGLERASRSKKATFKTTTAAEAMDDDGLRDKLRGLQERQINALGGVDGNWLVLGDKSGSMSNAIEGARHIAATLARVVKGKVYLVFFDTSPRCGEVTGKTYDQILAETKNVRADGGTSIGCGLLYAVEKGLEIDGIAVVSDGGENNFPRFKDVYAALAQATSKRPPIYFYKMAGNDLDVFSRPQYAGDMDIQVFDLTKGCDYYSLPAIVTTMRANRYSLIDEIMAVPLLELDAVLPPVKELAHA